MSSELAHDSLRQLVSDAVHAVDFRRATFSGPSRGGAPSPWVRVVVRPVEVRGERCLQFSYFDERKNIIKNCRGSDSATRLDELRSRMSSAPRRS